MEIKDLHENIVVITDLKTAIRQAKLYKSFRHKNPGFTKMDKHLKAYWTDIYNKLIILQNDKSNGTSL